MPANKVPPSERLASSFKQLASASDELNSAADQLSQVITTVEATLKAIKIGVSAWHTISGHDDPQTGNYWSRDIGYTKIGDDWGISIRRRWGNEYADERSQEEIWKFSDAPRWMCIEAVGKIPDLLDELVKRTQNTTKDLKAKTKEAREFATTLAALATEVAQARKQ